MRIYVGTYTRGESQGIYQLRLDLGTGTLTRSGEPTPASEPSFLALHPSGRYLYAVEETDTGSVAAFAIEPDTGALSLIGRQPSGGAHPCHLSLDAEGRHVLVANYTGGSASVFPVGVGGRLLPASAHVQHQGRGVDARRQAAPHAHSIDLDPGNRFALVSDLGLDRILVYGFDASRGALVEGDPPGASTAPGAGPRHLAFHPDGRHVYVIEELTSTVTLFGYDPGTGTLDPRQTLSTLPEPLGEVRNSTAEIAVRPDGRFVYGSNRGHDSIAIFAVDSESRRLEPAGHEPTRGEAPRHFAIDPSGRFLLAANQRSNTVAVFRIDQESGALEPVGNPLPVPTPVCLVFWRTPSASE
jgi:6-phosphogluconolactonase